MARSETATSSGQRVRSLKLGIFMGTGKSSRIPEVGPQDAWDLLSRDKDAVLVDVRTAPEWGFVGGPDLSELDRDVYRVEWKVWPDMSTNPDFVGQVMEQVEGLPTQFLFLCRSGVRSLAAAEAVAAALEERGTPVPCLNVSEGFEGDLDSLRHRGGLNGWKARGLAWRQT